MERRRGVELMLMTGLAWALAGCGMESIGRPAASVGGLILTDIATEKHFGLSVTDGALTLVEVSTSNAAPASADLVDERSGGCYTLAVSGGSLTLTPVSNAVTASRSISMVDASTSRTYALVVVAGALTLVPA